MYMNTLNSFFVAIVILVNTYFDKIIATAPPNLTILWNVHFIHILPTELAIVAYYAGIMLNAFGFPLCSKLCWHNMQLPAWQFLETSSLNTDCNVLIH